MSRIHQSPPPHIRLRESFWRLWRRDRTRLLLCRDKLDKAGTRGYEGEDWIMKALKRGGGERERESMVGNLEERVKRVVVER